MKTTNILKSLALFACVFAFMACEKQLEGPDDSNKVEPIFPELVENYAVEPGSTQELVFTPNLDWKLSIPSQIRQWFWIKDDTFTVTELKGAASTDPVKVYIGVTETPEFDKNYVCEVTLEMGDTSKVIAKYMLPAKERSVEVYAALKNEDGTYMLAEDGVSYQYSTTEATAADFVWSESEAGFIMPLRVVSNCEWSVEVPEWMEVNVPESTLNIIDLVFTGESLEAVTAKIAFTAGEQELASLETSIPSCDGMEIYAAQYDKGDFEYAEGGGYLWTESEVSEVTLVWMGSDFRMPVRIDSKCNWTIKTPEWLTVELPDKTAGDVSFALLGEPSKYPLDDATGVVEFKKGDTVLKTLKVTIPGCREIMTFSLDMSLTALEYNYLGRFKTSTRYVEGPATGRLMGTKGVKLFAVETTDKKLVKDPEWFKIELANWNTASGSAVLQDREVSFTVLENDGLVRTAVLFALPPSLAYTKVSELFNEDCTVKEAYQSYATSVSQTSRIYDEYITVEMVANPEFAYTFGSVSQSKRKELVDAFGQTDHVYTLNYTSPYCNDDAYMSMAIEFDTYKVYSGTEDLTDMSAMEDFWLQYRNGGDFNDYGVVDMYSNMELPVKPSVGYIVFYDSNKTKEDESDDIVLAIVECVSPFVPEVLEADNEELIFPWRAAEKTIKVEANVLWTVQNDADWCTVDVQRSAGSKSGVIVISTTENNTEQVRSAEILIKSEETETVRVVKIEQRFEDLLETNVSEINFECMSTSVKVKLSADVEWTISSDSDWCNVTPESSANDGSSTTDAELVVSVDRNFGTAPRTAVLTLRSNTLTRTLTVNQNYDDGTITNGDEELHFLDWTVAHEAGATLEVLTDGPIHKEFSDGKAPVYHLTYSSPDTRLRLVIPSKIMKHNVNPSDYKACISVNGVVYDEDFVIMVINGEEQEVLGGVLKDENSSVEITMVPPTGVDFMRGNINFTSLRSDEPVAIVVCTLDTSLNNK